MRLISILFLLSATLFLFSCSIEHHLSKAQKHIDIAKRKGAVIKPDTVWQYNYTKETVFDTITNTYKEVLKKDSTFQTINTTISAGMTKQERKALDDYYNHLEKMMKLSNDSLSKQINALVKMNGQNKKTEKVVARKENKNFPWFWLILPWCIIAGYIALKIWGGKLKHVNYIKENF